MMMTEVI